MIKCYFVDIKDISSDLPRSNFAESDLEQLANLILATDGLIRPLIIKETGAEKYTVIEGHREYYAALIAKEQNSSKAEMVNAFVINPKLQSSAIEQLKLIKEDSSPVITPASIPLDIEQLLPTLLAAISQQIQPLVEQLAEQKQILESLVIDRVNSSTVRVDPIEQPELPKPKDLPPIIPAVTTEPAKLVVTKPAKPPKAEKSKPDKAPKATTSKKVAALPESLAKPLPGRLDPIKATSTLNIINTLSQNELVLAMERSGISKAAIKLVPDIVAIRDSQPEQKFDTWEKIIALKIKGLGAATVKGMIEKLK
jgi:ParB-like nuclease domain